MWQKFLAWILGGVGLISGVAPTPMPTKNVTQEVGEFEYAFFDTGKYDESNLIYNYEAKTAGRDLVANSECKAAINGGFYDTANRPLGLVIVDGKQFFQNRPNKVFDGYVYKDRTGRMGIAERPIYANMEDVVQTGPMLMRDGVTVDLALTENTGRRMVAVGLANDGLMFLAIFGRQSRLDGPALAQLPGLVQEIATQNKWDMTEAVNLDGGSASYFFDGKTTLTDWQPVGSLWCLK